jgi:rod shape-determining protein MreD
MRRPFEDALTRRINRAPSPIVAVAVPWITVMMGSLAPAIPLIASSPILPPFGFMFLVAWRQIRPGLLPVWAGLPLGLFDDIYSGQPFGSAMLIWSVAMIILDMIEARFPWRNFWQEWLVGSLMTAVCLFAGALFANASGASTPPVLIAPQLVLAVLLYPLAGRLVAMFDRFRLLRFSKVG